MVDINKLIRPNIRNLKPYSSARSEFSGDDVILLDANENPSNFDGLMKGINRYPDPLQRKIKEKLSTIKAIASDRIFIGNGSDEAVDLIIRTFCRPGIDSIAIFPPTYGMYKVCAAINDINVIEFPLTENFLIENLDLKNTIFDDIKIIFICNPNNPSGNIQNKETLKEIIENFKGIVVVDEAYIDFCPDQSLVSELENFPNLIILQTLSKAWALAGARIGIAFASKEIVDILTKVKFPYNISFPSLIIADEALNKTIEAKSRIMNIIVERERLIKILPELPAVIKVYPSLTNFILIKTSDAASLYKYFLQNGIVVRNRDSEIGCKGCLRVTIGLEEENNRLLEVWGKYIKE
ncbi:MAG: histidinol-phosphate transaminase [Tenuifilaceae bacterium]